jgi:hypothetical protein
MTMERGGWFAFASMAEVCSEGAEGFTGVLLGLALYQGTALAGPYAGKK